MRNEKKTKKDSRIHPQNDDNNSIRKNEKNTPKNPGAEFFLKRKMKLDFFKKPPWSESVPSSPPHGCTCTCMRMHARACRCMHVTCVYIYMYVHACTCMSKYVHACARMCMPPHGYTSITCMSMHVRAYPQHRKCVFIFVGKIFQKSCFFFEN